jgi:hypothetical protein
LFIAVRKTADEPTNKKQKRPRRAETLMGRLLELTTLAVDPEATNKWCWPMKPVVLRCCYVEAARQ